MPDTYFSFIWSIASYTKENVTVQQKFWKVLMETENATVECKLFNMLDHIVNNRWRISQSLLVLLLHFRENGSMHKAMQVPEKEIKSLTW